MTHCLAIKVDNGLLFAADTRTNAGLDDVQVHRKIHTFESPGNFSISILSAGSLSTTQAVMFHLQHDLEEDLRPNLRSFQNLREMATYIGAVSVQQQCRIKARCILPIMAETTLIMGGQIAGEEPNIFLIDTQGQVHNPAPGKNYVQSGITAYAEPLLEALSHPALGLDAATRVGMLAINTTARSNLSVAPPIDIAVQHNNSLRLGERIRIYENTPFYRQLQLGTQAQDVLQVPWLPWNGGVLDMGHGGNPWSNDPEQINAELVVTIPSQVRPVHHIRP